MSPTETCQPEASGSTTSSVFALSLISTGTPQAPDLRNILTWLKYSVRRDFTVLLFFVLSLFGLIRGARLLPMLGAVGWLITAMIQAAKRGCVSGPERCGLARVAPRLHESCKNRDMDPGLLYGRVYATKGTVDRVALTANARRSLRSLQRGLDASVPSSMLDGVDRNDVKAWAALARREMRMLLARGQTQQARQIADRLLVAAGAGVPVETHDRAEVHLLIAAIDAVQAGCHYLALHQLDRIAASDQPTICWAAQLWRARSLAVEKDLGVARAAAQRAVEIAAGMESDAKDWAACLSAELQARAGEAEQAEQGVLHVLSRFIGTDEVRGASLGYLALAVIHARAGAREESETAAEMAYRADGSWCGPVVWLARLALDTDDTGRAEELLRSVPNPTADAYALLQALRLIAARGLPVSAIRRHLALAESPANDRTIDQLNALLKEHREYAPARATAAWKHLMRGELSEGEARLSALASDPGADRQAIAALRVGLQTYQEQQGVRKAVPPPIPQDAPAAAAQGEAPASEAPAEPPGKQGDFAGQLSLFGVTDLIQFFCQSRRSGTVLFSSQRGDARLRLHEGSICWAVSPSHPSVGRYLRDKEAISDSQLEKLAGDDDRLSAVVGGAALPQVRGDLLKLVHATIKDLVEWTDGWFVFDGAREGADFRPELLFNAQGVLLDVLRELDEERR